MITLKNFWNWVIGKWQYLVNEVFVDYQSQTLIGTDHHDTSESLTDQQFLEMFNQSQGYGQTEQNIEEPTKESIMKRNIAISVGHKPAHQGASNKGFTEYLESAIIAGLLVNYTGGYLIGTGTLGYKTAQINNGYIDGKPYEAAVEVHLNAGGGRGSETLHFPGSEKGKILATCIEDQMKTQYRSRGAKPGTWRMEGKVPLAFLARTNCPSVIVEPFFMDGDAHLLGNIAAYQKVARLIADGIIDALDKIK